MVHYEKHTVDRSCTGEFDDNRQLVVVVHGLCGAAATWRWDGPDGAHKWDEETGQRRGMAACMVQQGYDVLCYDHYGHGWSDAPMATYSADFFVGQLVELLFYLKVTKTFVLYSFSMGTYIAANFVARYPDRVRAMIIHSPWHHRLPCPVMQAIQIVPGLMDFAALMVRLGTGLVRVRTFSSIILNHHNQQPWENLLLDFADATGRSSGRQKLHKHDVANPMPLLIMCGDAEPWMHERALQIAQQLDMPPDAVVVCKGANHTAWFHGDSTHRTFFQSQVAKFIVEFDLDVKLS